MRMRMHSPSKLFRATSWALKIVVETAIVYFILAMLEAKFNCLINISQGDSSMTLKVCLGDTLLL